MTRLQKLEQALTAHQARIAEIEAELPTIDAAEEEARVEALRSAPDRRSDHTGAVGPVGRLAKRRRDREAELVGLHKEVAALQVALANERRQFVAERAAEAAKRLKEIRKAEEDAYTNLGAAFDAFVAVWLDEVAPAIEAHTEFVTELENDTELVTALGDYDRMPLVYPIARDIESVFKRLLIAADEMSSHYSAGAFSDYRQALPNVVTERTGLSAYVIRRFGNFDWTQSNIETPNWVDKPTTTAVSEAATAIAAEAL
jgi:hypothetical protein